ncbi:MAG: CAP domain-containing protein [Planctomycetaceae bacterium]|jgi:uncharacterized protein YkwD|nr:CAP domain-containing protein [Planctomycetaceae bacterium]
MIGKLKMNDSNTNVKSDLVVEATVASDRNCKINFAKASFKRCKCISCNMVAGSFDPAAMFGKLLTGVLSYLVRQLAQRVIYTKVQMQHYCTLYWLCKRGGIYGGKILMIFRKLFSNPFRLALVYVLLSVSFLSGQLGGNLFASERSWFEDFDVAMHVARTSGRNLLIYFSAEGNGNSGDSAQVANSGLGVSGVVKSSRNRNQVNQSGMLPYVCDEFERNVFESDAMAKVKEQFVVLKLSVDAKVLGDGGREVSVLELPMFKEMVKLPGLAIVDFADYDEAYYGEVIGVLPFINFTAPNQFQTTTFLTIPSCKLTQRTLTYAVKIHPDRPLSADGEIDQTLMTEATDHAAYQAKNRVLGHQNFSARSSRVRAILGEGISEVCAQSGLYNGHFEAALACVRGWRGSPAHWRSVRAKQKYFAYDMVQSSNGLWYATGLFVGQ